MAKNYQLAHKLSKHKWTNRANEVVGSDDTYFATCLTSRESVTVKLADLDQLDDYGVILNEILVTRSLRHVNILPLLTCFVHNSSNGTHLWRVYPHIYFGSCRDILDSIEAFYSPRDPSIAQLDEDTLVDRADEQKRLCFNEQSLQPITKSLLSALDYLHAKHIVHRRVEPDTIYIGLTGHVYLGGFDSAVSLISHGGLYKRLHDFPHSKLSVDYVAPEILQQNLIGYNTKSDIYSLGVTLCELANGANPFIGCEKIQMLLEKLAGYDIGLWDRSILTPEICLTENPKVIASVQRRYFSDKFRNFVDLCVQRESSVRPSAGELLTHSYLKKMKLHSCLSTFQMSIVADGIADLQKKSHRRPTQPQSQQCNSTQSIVNLNSAAASFESFSWNF